MYHSRIFLNQVNKWNDAIVSTMDGLREISGIVRGESKNRPSRDIVIYDFIS